VGGIKKTPYPGPPAKITLRPVWLASISLQKKHWCCCDSSDGKGSSRVLVKEAEGPTSASGSPSQHEGVAFHREGPCNGCFHAPPTVLAVAARRAPSPMMGVEKLLAHLWLKAWRQPSRDSCTI
jgi:hypothetical protein